MISCFTVLELYALSRHRCCSFLFLDKLRFVNDDDRLIIVLSITSVTSFISWVLADDMTTERWIPFVSVKMCLFVPSLPLSVGLLPVIAPPKGDFIDMLSSDCHVHLIPCLLSYDCNSLIHTFLKMSNSTHSWNLLWHVEPEPYSAGSIFHWHPVLRMYGTPSSAFLKGTVGRPIVLGGFSLGKTHLISSHNSSGILSMVQLSHLSFSFWIQATL